MTQPRQTLNIWAALVLASLASSSVAINLDASFGREYTGPPTTFHGLTCGMPEGNLPREAPKAGTYPSKAVFGNAALAGDELELGSPVDGNIHVFQLAFIQKGRQPTLLEAIKEHSKHQASAPVFKFATSPDVPSLPVGVVDIANRIAYLPATLEDLTALQPDMKVARIVYCVPDTTIKLYTKYIPKPFLDPLKAALGG